MELKKKSICTCSFAQKKKTQQNKTNSCPWIFIPVAPIAYLVTILLNILVKSADKIPQARINPSKLCSIRLHTTNEWLEVFERFEKILY